jgi:hypothetical protein
MQFSRPAAPSSQVPIDCQGYPAVGYVTDEPLGALRREPGSDTFPVISTVPPRGHETEGRKRTTTGILETTHFLHPALGSDSDLARVHFGRVAGVVTLHPPAAERGWFVRPSYGSRCERNSHSKHRPNTRAPACKRRHPPAGLHYVAIERCVCRLPCAPARYPFNEAGLVRSLGHQLA